MMQPPFGFCFPCYALTLPGTGRRKKQGADVAANPFPLLFDLQTAYTFGLTKTCWIPARPKAKKEQYKGRPAIAYSVEADDFAGWMIQSSHEAMHVFLLDTVLVDCMCLLKQFQLIAIAHAVDQGYQVRIPSLDEPLGYLAKAQEAFDTLDAPMAFIHELIAVTAVLVCAKRGCLPATTHLAQVVADGGDKESAVPLYDVPWDLRDLFRFEEEMANERLKESEQYPFRGIEIGSKLGQTIEQYTGTSDQIKKGEGEDSWLAFYAKIFPGYHFPEVHEQLLKAWNKIADSMDPAEWLALMLHLARYPLNPTLSRSSRPLKTAKGFLNRMASYVKEMSQEPLARLQRMVDVIEKADGLNGATAWLAYLRKNLPEFDDELRFSNLDLITKQLWEDHGFASDGELFAKVYSDRGKLAGVIIDLPIVKKRPAHSALGILMSLEVMLQALLAMKYLAGGGKGLSFNGLKCLCASACRPTCVTVSGNLRGFWHQVRPDKGYEELFAQQLSSSRNGRSHEYKSFNPRGWKLFLSRYIPFS